MATSRTSIVRGPGTVSYAGSAIFDADGIDAEIESSVSEIPSSISGSIASIKTDQVGRISFTPCGQLSAALLSLLYPYANPTVGASACGTADRALTVHSLAGVKVTFPNAVLSKMPELRLSPVKTAFGAVEFAAAVALAKSPETAGSLYSVETAAYSSGAPDPDGITGAAYAGTFGDLAIADTLDGWTVTPEITLEPVAVDSIGTIDWTVGAVSCTATCTPVGLSESQILAALPINKARGSILGGDDLVISGAGGLKVTLKNASLVRGPLRWGTTDLRAGQIQFTAHRTFTDGTPGPVFSVELAS